MSERLPAATVAKALGECPAFRISPGDTNYFALLFDSEDGDCGLVSVVEIFEPGGSTPPNVHQRAHEVFYVLAGEGRANVGGTTLRLRQGDAIMVRPGSPHMVENLGPGKLYCLTTMVPDENFAALIRAGTRVELDEEDLAVLGGGRRA